MNKGPASAGPARAAIGPGPAGASSPADGLVADRHAVRESKGRIGERDSARGPDAAETTVGAGSACPAIAAQALVIREHAIADVGHCGRDADVDRAPFRL